MSILREWRERAGKTQEQVAADTGIPSQTLSKYERGVLVPGLKNALKIARATNGQVPVDAWEKPSDDDTAAAGGEPKVATA